MSLLGKNMQSKTGLDNNESIDSAVIQPRKYFYIDNTLLRWKHGLFQLASKIAISTQCMRGN